MKCKAKDCKDCKHFINIKTHPLFKDFLIKDESGKILDFEGCIFHLGVLFLRQIWVRNIGIQSSLESGRNENLKGLGSIYGALLEFGATKMLDAGDY